MTIEQDLAKSSLSGLKSFGKVLGPVGIVLSTIDFGIEMASCEKNYAGK